jgi:hypothetical protein
VDEGTILLAHNIFVTTVYSPEEIGRFASLVPLPHVIVYVKLQWTALSAFTLRRIYHELRSRDQELIEKTSATVDMFDQLVQYANIQSADRGKS